MCQSRVSNNDLKFSRTKFWFLWIYCRHQGNDLTIFDNIVGHLSPRNSRLGCHKCPTSVSDKCPTHSGTNLLTHEKLFCIKIFGSKIRPGSTAGESTKSGSTKTFAVASMMPNLLGTWLLFSTLATPFFSSITSNFNFAGVSKSVGGGRSYL